MNDVVWRIFEIKCRKYETLTPRLQTQLMQEAVTEAEFAAYTMKKCMAGGNGR